MLNGYIAYYNGKEREIYANSMLDAVTAAKAYFKPAKSNAHMVHAVLCEKDGVPVTHSTAAFG